DCGDSIVDQTLNALFGNIVRVQTQLLFARYDTNRKRDFFWCLILGHAVVGETTGGEIGAVNGDFDAVGALTRVIYSGVYEAFRFVLTDHVSSLAVRDAVLDVAETR